MSAYKIRTKQSGQPPSFQERIGKLARVRALILQAINKQPGLTYEEIGKAILLRHGFLPRVGNRIRELRTLGYVTTQIEADSRLHVYPQRESER